MFIKSVFYNLLHTFEYAVSKVNVLFPDLPRG